MNPDLFRAVDDHGLSPDLACSRSRSYRAASKSATPSLQFDSFTRFASLSTSSKVSGSSLDRSSSICRRRSSIGRLLSSRSKGSSFIKRARSTEGNVHGEAADARIAASVSSRPASTRGNSRSSPLQSLEDQKSVVELYALAPDWAVSLLRDQDFVGRHVIVSIRFHSVIVHGAVDQQNDVRVRL